MVEVEELEAVPSEGDAVPVTLRWRLRHACSLSFYITDPLLMLHIEAPWVEPVAMLIHGPAPIAEMCVQDGQALLELLTNVERRTLAIEFFLENLTFQAESALHEFLQTASLVAQQAVHFLDGVQDNARFFRQHPAQLVAAR